MPRREGKIQMPWQRTSANSTGAHSLLFSWNDSVSEVEEARKGPLMCPPCHGLFEHCSAHVPDRLCYPTRKSDTPRGVTLDTKHFGSPKKVSGSLRAPLQLGLRTLNWSDVFHLSCYIIFHSFFLERKPGEHNQASKWKVLVWQKLACPSPGGSEACCPNS